MALDLTSFDAALKQHYTDDRVENLVYEDRPLLAIMPKMEDFGGRNLPINIIYGNPQGRSALFSQAQSRAGTSLKIEDFLLTRVSDHMLATIDSETLEASKGDPNSFMEAATATIDGIISELSNTIARDLYRGGWGTLGIVGSGSGDTVTLSNADDVVNFSVGQVCVFATSESGATLRNSGAGLEVESVDRGAGTVTFTAALSTESVGTGDYIFTKGDREDSATPTRRKIAGLDAWCPSTAPSASESFFGVDRSVDSRLSGVRYAPSAGTPLSEILVTGANRVGREGGRITHYFMNFNRYDQLVKELGSKVQYVDADAKAGVSFRAVEIHGGRGTIKVVADHNCPSNRIFGLCMPHWKLYSLGKMVRVNDNDGNMMLRQASADGVEIRYVFRGNVGCRAPGWNVNIALSD